MSHLKKWLNRDVVLGDIVTVSGIARITTLTNPDRVYVAAMVPHPSMKARGRTAKSYYQKHGTAARRIYRDDAIVYRLPWRLWRYRHWDASGDWRAMGPDGGLTLVGIVLLNQLTMRGPR